jgi:hypothetical protein
MPDQTGFTDAADFGFSPDASPRENVTALQSALDGQGTVLVTRPGVYELCDTVLIGSNTTLRCGNGVAFKKVPSEGPFTHVILNRGALTRTYDEHIRVEGLHIMVNGVDLVMREIYGLRGHLAFFYVKDLRVTGFRCYDLEPAQFCVHICTFEDVVVDDVIIRGKKDGVHLGPGKRFTITNGVFETVDDAIALNAQDYTTSNPERGWIEGGLVQNCYDLPRPDGKFTGFFCRLLAGGWVDWFEGMEIQHSDAVVSNGLLYRCEGKPDGATWTSTTRPTHAEGKQVLDGITWSIIQKHEGYTAGVRNVTFRDIFIEEPRVPFCLACTNSRYNRGYYPGAEIPMQEDFHFDNVRVLHGEDIPFLSVNTPIDFISVRNSRFRKNRIRFGTASCIPDFGKTSLLLAGNTFRDVPVAEIVDNALPNKEIEISAVANTQLG